MKKKAIISLICVFAILTAGISADFEQDARALYDLGLIKGTGESFSMEALDLDRSATRAEACMTLLRMLGKEEKANYQANPHPFTDVPDWASACIGWLYENRIVNGAAETYFGADDIATVKQFSAMTLRALGYNESEGDFDYDRAVEKALSVGLFDETVGAKYELLRRDMIEIISKAMKTNLRDSYRTLAEKLCDDGAINRALAEELGFL
ncbi:MAG: S-layer homology domain-containing protein, partial [Clostridia bacterium]|nr:S-layer homology domain-containing protein [Clostridia bacterium]